MELPPYHKPAFRNTMYVTFQRTLDIFLRALRVISLVSIVFFVLTYGFGGNAENSILCKIGVWIEPVTMFFGLKWQAFLAFCASAISKESLLGVLNTLYGAGGSLVSSTFGAKVSGTAAAAFPKFCLPISPKQRDLPSYSPLALICPASALWLQRQEKPTP